MSVLTVVGIIAVLALIVGIGLFSGRKVEDSGDFLTGGGKVGAWMVCGTIMGSLVSSQATMGTAQLAFNYGLSAWWFTLGSGIGCLILGLGYASSLRKSGCVTELQIISKEYGTRIEGIASVLCAVGIGISVLAQVVACCGLITVLFPSMPAAAAAAITIAVMIFYVVFGGAWGAGMGGVVKLILLYVSSIVGMIAALVLAGGFGALSSDLTDLLAGTQLGSIQEAAAGLENLETAADVSSRYYSLIARGASKDIGSGLSLLLGVLSTQTYAQAIWSAGSTKKAKRGAFLSACLIPPLGIAGIVIGLFMRANYITQAEVDALTAAGLTVPDLPVLASTIQVFPTFVLNHLPALLGGIILGTLFITSVGGGAGLSLGMATILVKDIFKKIKGWKDSMELKATRLTILVILIVVAVIAVLVPGSTINDLGFLSMGLRGTVVLVPLSCALFLPGKIDSRFVLIGTIAAPVVVLIGNFISLPVDSLFPGILVSILCCAGGYIFKKFHKVEK